jgi:hypothetical protein
VVDTNVPLRRLLDQAGVQALFANFRDLRPGSAIALFDRDGRLFAGENNGAWAEPEALLSQIATGAREENGVCVRPLVVQNRRLGSLAGRGPICGTGLAALEQGLILILDAALKTREVARETLERYREINLLGLEGAGMMVALLGWHSAKSRRPASAPSS